MPNQGTKEELHHGRRARTFTAPLSRAAAGQRTRARIAANHFRRALALGFVIATTACGPLDSGRTGTFATWRSEEPDTLASIWLIESYLFPGERVRILPPGANTTPYVSFATPDATYSRTAEHTAFAALLAAHAVDDPALWRLSEILDLIEISPWRKVADREALTVESLMREVQRTFPGSLPCAIRFYDALYEALSAGEVARLQDALWDEQSAFLRCDNGEPRVVDEAVAMMPIEALLDAIALGKQVRFVDTRETPEYERGHIPGAVNLKLRDINAAAIDRLRGADLIVPYCVKDFRGYEVARVLANEGLPGVAVMLPHGLAGWHQVGLPVATGVSESRAREYASLRDCAASVDRCGYRGPSTALAARDRQ